MAKETRVEDHYERILKSWKLRVWYFVSEPNGSEFVCTVSKFLVDGI